MKRRPRGIGPDPNDDIAVLLFMIGLLIVGAVAVVSELAR
jgi:hypothetical protein